MIRVRDGLFDLKFLLITKQSLSLYSYDFLCVVDN